MALIDLLTEDERRKAASKLAADKLAVYKLNNPNEPDFIYAEEYIDLYDFFLIAVPLSGRILP
jgi:hypothetical protein